MQSLINDLTQGNYSAAIKAVEAAVASVNNVMYDTAEYLSDATIEACDPPLQNAIQLAIAGWQFVINGDVTNAEITANKIYDLTRVPGSIWFEG